MAKQKYVPEPAKLPSISHEQGRQLMQALIERGKALLAARPLAEAKNDAWRNSAGDAIKKTFGSDSNHLSSFWGPSVGMVMVGGDDYYDETHWEQKRAEGLDEKIKVLESLVDEIDFQLKHFVSTQTIVEPTGKLMSNDVFVVHGHDEANLNRLKEMLEKEFRLNPIVLKNEPDQSRTVIQKFTDEAQKCSFAFILLTPDDEIHGNSGDYVQARPNVIFELGWFWAKLGPKKVLMLLKKGTKIHTDLDGVLRKDFTESVEERFLDVKRELQAAGII